MKRKAFLSSLVLASILPFCSFMAPDNGDTTPNRCELRQERLYTERDYQRRTGLCGRKHLGWKECHNFERTR